MRDYNLWSFIGDILRILNASLRIQNAFANGVKNRVIMDSSARNVNNLAKVFITVTCVQGSSEHILGEQRVKRFVDEPKY